MSSDSHVVTEFYPNTIATQLRLRAVDLEVTRGPDLGLRARVDRPTFVIGQGETADLRLSDRTVSREHLRLSLSPAGVHVRDEGSRNGSWIRGIRIADATITTDTAIELGLSKLDLRIETDPLVLQLSLNARFGDAIGISAAMRHLFALLERASASDVTVLIEGESGVGKEVLARAVHAQSPRAAGPFIALDCGAIPAGLIESELFGHEKGAFTGATEGRKGVFEQAHGGTLFLDEVGELQLELQPKLLRVLEQREIRPVGSSDAVRPVDVRVIAATNRRLAEAAHKNEFRRDLFYRLSVAHVTVPPLRDRPEDIVPLARAFLRTTMQDEAADLPGDLGAMLTAYRWPGNVRELRNVIERYTLLGARDEGDLFHAGGADPDKRHGDDFARLPYHEARRCALERFERAYLTAVLQRAGGIVTKAAEHAQVARPSFYRMLQRVRAEDRTLGADNGRRPTIPPDPTLGRKA